MTKGKTWDDDFEGETEEMKGGGGDQYSGQELVSGHAQY